jgi:hypothetical protein
VASPAPMRLRSFISLIEKETGKSCQFASERTPENQSPFGPEKDWSMNVDCAKQLGIQPRPIDQWLPDLIRKLV